MPEVTPKPGDIIQIKITGVAGYTQVQLLPAEITGRKTGNDFNEWVVRVPGEPELTGVVNIEQYQWDHKQGRWLPKAAKIPPVPKYDTSAQPSGAAADELSIPRAAG